MRKFAVPEVRVLGAKRRINPLTFMPEWDSRGRPLWDMPGPTSYVEHKSTGKRITEPIRVPVYRGVSASYERYVKAQIRRNRRKQAEKAAALQAEADELNKAQMEELINEQADNEE